MNPGHMTQENPRPQIVFETHETDDILFVESLCWRLLAEAVTDRRSAMHNVVVGTTAAGIAHLRTVIIRRVDTDVRKAYFHTDIRSGKIAEIREAGYLSWLAYDASRRSQLRFGGPTALHHRDELCRLHWQSTKRFSRRCYLLPEGPGLPLAHPGDPFDERLSGFSYTSEESEAGFDHFVVVETDVEELEWYYTHNRGNRRARFRYASGALLQSDWLTP